MYSNRSWPIDGGKLLCSKEVQQPQQSKRELLLTGHEDGTVRFWDASGVTLTPIYKFSTAQFFAGDDFEGKYFLELLEIKKNSFVSTMI